MSETVEIRLATLEDAEILAKIGWQSFDEAFADHPANHPADMKIYMDEAFSVETITADLRDEKTVYLIAELTTETAGYAKIKFDSREDCITAENTLELCRLYALDKFIGKGVGKFLMLALFELAEEQKRDTVWLGVWEFNYRAQKFYRKFGFEKCGEHVFQLGTDPQIDWIMKRTF
ncbi:MAG: GNAT family N-acetyltransferase [Actinomycetota bacterium]